MDPKSTTITIRVSHELHEMLRALAEEEERTLSQYCMLVLRRHAKQKKKPG
jgi:predicted HicB family RNase H-like nuclease